MVQLILSPLDVPILLLLGAVSAVVHRRLVSRSRDSFVFLQLIVALFWIDMALVWTTGIQPWGVLPSASVPATVAVFYTLSYLLWFRLGAELVFMLIGRTPAQGGILWLYRLDDRTEEFEPSWTG